MARTVTVLENTWVIVQERCRNQNSYLSEGSSALIKVGGSLTVITINNNNIIATYRCPEGDYPGGACSPDGAKVAISLERFNACTHSDRQSRAEKKTALVNVSQKKSMQLSVAGIGIISVVSLILWIIGIPGFLAIGLGILAVILLEGMQRLPKNEPLLLPEPRGPEWWVARKNAYDELVREQVYTQEEADQALQNDIENLER